MRPLVLLSLLAAGTLAPVHSAPQSPLSFRKHVLASGLVMNSVAAADLDGDGRVDVAAAGPEEVAWYRRDAAGAWTKHLVRKQSPETGSLDTIWLAPHDLDGDRDLDLVSSTPNAAGNLSWHENPGAAGKEWAWHLIDRLPKIHSAVLEDLDGDRRPELIANTEGALVWYAVPRRVRDARPEAATGLPGEGPRWKRRVLTQDGVAGTPHYLRFGRTAKGGERVLLAASPDPGYLAWWKRSGTGPESWVKHAVREPFPGASHLIPMDMDADGTLDLFYNRGHSAGSGWLAGPEFSRTVEVDPGTLKEPHALALGDLNGDGAPDVAACARNSGGMVAWLNDGKGRFTEQRLEPDQRAMDLRIADVDGDGDQDLLVAGATGRNLVVYENLRR